MRNRISYLWKEADAKKAYRTGVSLHSHTHHSRESLSFVSILASRYRAVEWYLERHQLRAAKGGAGIDLFKACWTPPLTARDAHDLERRQIEEALGMEAIVSLSDHDNIDAATKLRVVPGFEDTTVSVEWTVPYRESIFHIGIHNLPPGDAASIMRTLASYTAEPRVDRLDGIFRYLNEQESALVVFNHPRWNLNFLEGSRFNFMLADFLSRYSTFIHAFELNGLRSWRENQDVAKLAYGWNQPVISGGDRHGREPNGNLNLTNASTFAEFAHEIRVRRVSHVMFMPQYADPIALRFVQTFLDVIREYPDKPEGAKKWDQRTLHPDRNGVLRPVAEQWGSPPYILERVFSLTRKLEGGPAQKLWRAAGRNEALCLRLMDTEVAN